MSSHWITGFVQSLYGENTVERMERIAERVRVVFDELGDKYVMQLERGSETRRLHIQYLFHGKKKTARAGFANKLRAKLPPGTVAPDGNRVQRSVTAQAVKNLAACKLYCQDPKKTISGPWLKGIGESSASNRELWVAWYAQRAFRWFPWQQDLLALSLIRPLHNRAVLWIFDRTGGAGKTTMLNYLLVHHAHTMLVTGAGKYAKHALARHPLTSLVITTIPRSAEDYVSYSALESVKDGIFFNAFTGDAEMVFLAPGTQCWVFANFPPDQTKLSMDRWMVIDLEDPWDLIRLQDYVSSAGRPDPGTPV